MVWLGLCLHLKINSLDRAKVRYSYFIIYRSLGCGYLARKSASPKLVDLDRSSFFATSFDRELPFFDFGLFFLTGVSGEESAISTSWLEFGLELNGN